MATFPTTNATVGVGTGAVQLSTSATYCSSLIIEADASNTDNIYVGGQGVTTSTGITVRPGGALEITPDDVFGVNKKLSLDKVYIISGTSAQVARVLYLRWDGL